MRCLLIFLLGVAIVSCSAPAEKLGSISNSDSTVVYQPSAFRLDKLTGMYSGDFGGSGDIRVVIRHASGRHAVGYSLHKGLRRNFSGSMKAAENGFSFLLSEPGDNPYDGTFDFAIDTASYTLKGKWTPANPAKVTEKTYVLQRNWSDTIPPHKEIFSNVFSDSLGDFTFHESGLVSYRYYPKTNGQQSQQFEEINGNWTLKDDSYVIDWQPNKVFPSRHSILKKELDADRDTSMPEEYYMHLSGEGRKLYQDNGF